MEPAQVNQLLVTLHSQEEVSFPALLECLFAAKFRGALVLHFDGGEPKKVEFPAPQMKLTRHGP